jgi:hypothetical protein
MLSVADTASCAAVPTRTTLADDVMVSVAMGTGRTRNPTVAVAPSTEAVMVTGAGALLMLRALVTMPVPDTDATVRSDELHATVRPVNTDPREPDTTATNVSTSPLPISVAGDWMTTLATVSGATASLQPATAHAMTSATNLTTGTAVR